MFNRRNGPGSADELSAALAGTRSVALGVAAMSGVVNVLYLTGSFFMLQVYDRVIPSRSYPTLIGLGILVVVLYAFQGALDVARARILTRVGAGLDLSVSRRVFGLIMRIPLAQRGGGDGMQPMRDLDGIRSFLGGGGPIAFFDLPWIPLYIGICYLFHPLIGLVALCGAILLAVMTFATEILTRGPVRAATASALRRGHLAETGRRNAETLRAMSMGRPLADRFEAENAEYLARQERASDVAGGMSAVTKMLRMALQSGVLALGAYLVIDGQATGGIIIASSILTARALAPVELAIANWKGFVAARQGWGRLSELLRAMPPEDDTMKLPPPARDLVVEHVSVAPPGIRRLIVHDASFALRAGQGLGIIGASASGKSSLARALVGIWTPATGQVRLDGAALDQWHSDALGRHVGFLPQTIELFPGTVADNIARLAREPDPAAIIKAATAAGVHDLILSLPAGYDTLVAEGGASLSSGQQQRIALARALYGEPFLVVLDEPNSNLDQEGEAALTNAILGVRRRGGIVVVIAHRPSALAGIDHVLIMADGRIQAYGPKEEIMARLTRPPTPSVAPAGALRVVREPQGATA